MRDLILVGALSAVATGVVAFIWFLLWKARYTRAVRDDAVTRSQAVTSGKVFEQLVPHLPGFEFNPRDARFLGSPVDFVVFDGLCEGEVRRVVFLEVKTGGSQLTSRELTVRNSVRAGHVEWAELRADRALIP